MADIRQELGIDVSQALRALDAMDRRLEQFGSALDRVSAKLRSFNSVAQRAFRLGNVTGDLDKAATSTQKVVRGFAGFAGAAQTANSATQSVATNLNNTGVAATTTASKISSLAARFRAFGASSAASIGSLTISFQTLARIVSVQVLVRSLNAFTNALKSSVASAIEFEQQIAQIQTISLGSAFRDFDTAAIQVRKLSDAFNISLGDVGAGLYQTISQQIRGTANQVEVLTQSLILSKVGVASAEDSVALLTGTLNAFELSAAEASRVATVFFRLVDLGDTTISELGTSFGTVSTLAFEAGASFEELAAAFAVVTIRGVDTAKAATQLRGVFNALIKPTKDLQRVLSEAGFATGEQALQTIGLAGAINLIGDAAGGSQTELAKLIPRLRGITAALILGRDGAEQFKTQLDIINETAERGIQEEFEIRINTNAEQVTRTVNQLSNALTVDLGQGILKALAFMTQFTTVNQTATRAVQILSPLVIVTAGAFGLYTIAAGIAAIANSKFTASTITAIGSLAGLRLALVLTAGVFAVAALGVGVFFATQSASAAAAQRIADDIKRANAGIIKSARETRQELLKIERQDITDRAAQVTTFVRNVRISLTDQLTAWKDSSDRIKANTTALYSDILDANRAFVDTLKKNADDAAKAQIDSQQRVATLRQSLEDTAFKASLQGRDPVSQTFLQQQRAAELATAAAEKLASAVRPTDVSDAVNQSERARSLAEEAVQTARTSGNRAAISRALANQRSIVDQIIQAELKQQQIQKQREADSRIAAANEESRVRSLETQIDKILSLQKDFDPSASLVDRERIIKEIEGAFKEVRKLSIPDGSKLTADQLIDLAKLKSDVQNSFKIGQTQGIDIDATLSGSSLKNLSVEITRGVENAMAEGIRRGIAGGTLSTEQLAGIQTDTRTKGAAGALESLVNALNSERDRLLQVEANGENVLRASENLKEAGQVVASQLDRSNSALEGTSKALLTLPAALLAGIQQATGSTRLTRPEATSQLNGLEEQLRGLPERSQFLKTDQLQTELQDFNNTFKGIVDNLGIDALLLLGPQIRRINEAIQKADQEIQTSIQQGTSLQENLEKSLEGVRKTGAEATTSASNLDSALNSGKNNAAAIAQSMAATAQSAQQAALASSRIGAGSGGGGQTQNAAFGGLIRYFNNGGFTPRGTDTVPAMLSPGEFVVNAKSTKRFFSQLQSINSGVQPRFFQDGGAVTNVGDINVTVSDSRGGDSTGRDIARSLRRELRRKTSSF